MIVQYGSSACSCLFHCCFHNKWHRLCQMWSILMKTSVVESRLSFALVYTNLEKIDISHAYFESSGFQSKARRAHRRF